MAIEIEFEKASAAFFHQMSLARKAGKDWWVALQVRQIEETLWRDKKIAELMHALEMVRDADEDCKKDGLPTIPPIARGTIDLALERSKLDADPQVKSFAAFLEERGTK